MTLALIFLLSVFALKGLISFVPAFSSVGTVLGWLLTLFLVLSVLVDFFRNIPSFLLIEYGVGSTIEQQIQNWKLRYVFLMGASIFIRVVTVLLLVQWFLFPTVHILGI